MTQQNTHIIPVGIVAGLFAGVIGMAMNTLLMVSPLLAIIVVCFISLPIFIAAFGWGTLSSIIALSVATFVLIIAQNFYIGISYMLLFFLPAVYASWLLGLAQYDTDNQTVKWYPLSSVIFLIISFISIICVLIGVYIYNQPSTPLIAQQIADVFTNAMRQTQSADGADISEVYDLLVTNIVPFLSSGLATYSVIFLIGNLYFSLVGAQRMKRLARPREDWPTNFCLPLPAVFIFALAFLGTFLELGMLFKLCAVVFNTTFMLAFCFCGLAYLHNLSRGMGGRVFILALVYIALFTVVLTLPIFIVLVMMGIWSTIQNHRQNDGLTQ